LKLLVACLIQGFAPQHNVVLLHELNVLATIQQLRVPC
jgi:hypothetical protein